MSGPRPTLCSSAQHRSLNETVLCKTHDALRRSAEPHCGSDDTRVPSTKRFVQSAGTTFIHDGTTDPTHKTLFMSARTLFLRPKTLFLQAKTTNSHDQEVSHESNPICQT